jgi:hypothetical protein
MLDRYGLVGAVSGIAIALYLFSLIEKRTIHGSAPARLDASEERPIGLPGRAEGDGMLSLVFVAEWGAVAVFVLAELLPGEFQTWLKASAVWCGGSIAILYAVWVKRLRRLGSMKPRSPQKPAPKRGSGSRRLRGRIRTHN